MTHTSPDAEEVLEKAALALFEELDWATANAYYETYTEAPDASAGASALGQATRNEVILRPRLEAALARLNPDLPPDALQQATQELTRDRSAMTLVHANRETYAPLKDGVRVTFRDADGDEQVERVRAVDWAEPRNNDFLPVQQFWVTGDVYTRRADLAGFVNGLPMRNHTLMQTIARANRVFGEKVNGLIVDYIGIFRDLQEALAIYGTGRAANSNQASALSRTKTPWSSACARRSRKQGHSAPSAT